MPRKRKDVIDHHLAIVKIARATLGLAQTEVGEVTIQYAVDDLVSAIYALGRDARAQALRALEDYAKNDELGI